jgi:hypothetical protein
MARESKKMQPSGEQEEMTVVILRFKGGGDSLQKGFETVSQALAILGQPPVHHQRRLPPVLSATPTVSELPGPEKNADALEGEENFEDSEGTEVSRQRSGSAHKYGKPKFDGTLDLDAGDVKFRDYCAQKKPANDNDKYLVAAAWLTEHGGHVDFTANQLFTCFRAMTWSEQKDFMQPMRTMMKNKSYFEKTARKSWKLTSVGLTAAKAVSGEDGE